MSGPNSPPPGWYPDPSDSQRVRYWDGSTWSGPSRPASPSAANSWSLESSPYRLDPKPWWQTSFAIVPGLLLCLPVGLVGLWLRKGTRTLVKTGVTVGTVLLLGIAFLTSADSVPTTPAIPAATPSPVPTASTTPAGTPSDTPSPSPSLARVPAVEGLSLIKAKRELRAAGLAVGDIDRRPSSKAKDTVLKQGESEGEELERGSSVALVIAAPYARVPSVIGNAEASASRTLKNAGFQVKKTTQTRTTGEDEVVLSQSPRGEARAKPNSVVRIVISNVQPSTDADGSSNCTPGYSPCLPPASDYDCRGGSGNGPEYTGPVRVTGSDPYDLDRDGDGKACEWS
jgi:resuscitation-promoting factor RpfB